jgi:hypothetical protein
MNAITPKVARMRKVYTYPPSDSILVRNIELTIKLLIQLVAVAIATAVPTK